MFQHMLEGGFVVRQSSNRNVNSVTPDQTLEQSINHEARCKGGIVGFTLCKGALLRWLMTQHVTGEYAESFKVMCQVGPKDKLHEELGNARLQRDGNDVNNMKEYIANQCRNPFDLDDVTYSFMNITTGQVASREVQQSLKHIPEIGKSVCDDFLKERLSAEQTRSFWDPLKKCNVLTFSDMKKALTNK